MTLVPVSSVAARLAALCFGSPGQVPTPVAEDTPLPVRLAATEYETVAASATDQVLGLTGGAGDLLNGLLIVPATTSPGAVSIKDGAGASITIFTGGATSVADLTPFWLQLGLRSGAGAWKLTTGANVSVIAAGNFS